jgi:hypothetical protein
MPASKILACAITTFLTALPLAQAHVSAISAATASAGRAAIESLDVPFQNPAGIAFAKGYSFATGLSRYSSEVGIDQEELAVLLSDNTPDSVVPTSLAYVQKTDQVPGSDWQQKDVRLSLGNFIGPRRAVGFGLNYRQERINAVSSQQASLTVGSIFGVSQNLGVALVIDNLFPIVNAPEAREQFAPLTSLGMSYNMGKFLRARMDLTTQRNNSLNKPLLAAGLENYWNRWLIFRIGAARDAELEQSILSTGLGFDGPRLGIHYAFQAVEAPLGRDQRHSVDLALTLW